jgi:tripartite ATP-independent transporter DctM subunit
MFEISMGFAIFFILVFFGQEIFVSMAASVVGMILLSNMDIDTLMIIPQTMIFGVESLELAAIPLFILSGELMNAGGITSRLVTFSRTLVGHVQGGLSMVAVLVNMIMAGVSGSAVADASSTGTVLIPAMKEEGYDVDYAAALIASAATIGPIIPPSIPMIVFAVVSQASVGKLFLGGALPGLLMGLALMVTCYIIARRHNYPKLQRTSFKGVMKAFSHSFLALAMPVFVMVGVVSGFATITEIAGVAAAYSGILGFFIYRRIKASDLPRIFSDTAVTSAIVLVTLATANSFGWLMSMFQVGAKLMSVLSPISQDPTIILLLINLAFLFIGCVFEPLPALVIFVPIMLPVITSLGIDIIHFGLIVVLNLMIGLLTPPVGLNFFITAAIANRPPEAVIKKLWPFFITLILVLVFCTLYPPIVTWLPNLLIK